jgi:hypothetical protein
MNLRQTIVARVAAEFGYKVALTHVLLPAHPTEAA